MLGKNKVFGRNKDKSLEQQLGTFDQGKKDQEEDRVRIEYFDKKGKKLTLKEAFRQMCWKFHGKMPSHRKQEKRKIKEELLEKKDTVGTEKKVMGKLGTNTKKIKKI